MSTRYMKKVYGDDVICGSSDESSNEVDIPTTHVKSKSFNLFSVFNEDPEDDEKEHESTENGEITEDESVNEPVIQKKQNKKKKKQKKSEAKKNYKCQNEKLDKEPNDNDDEIEKTIQEVNKLLGEPPKPSVSSEDNIEGPQWSHVSKLIILGVERKYLNPVNELKKIFGSKTIQAEQSVRKKPQRNQFGHLKKTCLVTAKDNWPPIGKYGLSMSLDSTINTDENVQYFVYEHNSSYKQVQHKFLQAVESLNPENIVNVVKICSYHVDALLQLAELCKLNEDLPMAAEFTERALYSLECAFHPMFNLTNAQCRLDYKKQQNRALFITLFKHLGFVGGRACNRTALELCKLLLSFEPNEDPLAVILCLDYYSLRAKEYNWFVQFCDLWEESRNLSQLPNIAYSLALAHFHLGNESIADELIQKALIMFPGVLRPLLDKCSVQVDSKVIGHDFFNSKASNTTSPVLEKLQNLYIARIFHLWKDESVILWLEHNVHAVLKRVDEKDEYVKYSEVKRGKRYKGQLPQNILRHIILSDIKDVAISMNETQNESPILLHDPLPPRDSIDLYPRPETNTRRRLNNSNTNIFSLFLSSLFTDIEGEVVAAYDAVAAAHNAAAAVLNAFNLFDENDE